MTSGEPPKCDKFESGGPVEGDSHARQGAAMADIYFYQVLQQAGFKWPS